MGVFRQEAIVTKRRRMKDAKIELAMRLAVAAVPGLTVPGVLNDANRTVDGMAKCGWFDDERKDDPADDRKCWVVVDDDGDVVSDMMTKREAEEESMKSKIDYPVLAPYRIARLVFDDEEKS